MRGKLGVILALASGATWGTYGIFTNLLLDRGISSPTITLILPVVLILCFTVFYLREDHSPYVFRLKDFLILMAITGSTNWLMTTSYVNAYSNGMPSGIVATTAAGHMVIAVIGSRILFRTPITTAKLVAMVMALSGVGLSLGLFGSGGITLTRTGILWTLVIPLTYAVGLLLNKWYVSRGMSPNMVIIALTTGSIIVNTLNGNVPSVVIANITQAASQDATVIIYLLGLCLIPIVSCYIFMQLAMPLVDPGVFSICYAVDPLTATLLGFLVFGQSISLTQVLGMALILAAIYLINRPEKPSAVDVA